jgi:putative tryptophan/tyrosine transport system substrate-binding protein
MADWRPEGSAMAYSGRREFISLLGGAAVWPIAARAQQPMPVIGFLSSVHEDGYILAAFRRGLLEQGYVEGHNVSIETRYANGRYDGLPALAAELAARPVNVIVALPSSPAALAAKSATQKIPIVFSLGADAVELGLVASYNRPGGNATGVSVIATSLTPKRLELLDQLVPKAAPIAELINPTNRLLDEELNLARKAAGLLGRELIVVGASTEVGLDAAFKELDRQGAAGLTVWQEAYFLTRRDQIVALAQRYRLPTIYPNLAFTKIGGLMSYGSNNSEAFRQVGMYVGKILSGASPADLPVLQPTTYELLINLKTAKALGLEIPPTLLARADEVIE